MAPAPRERWRRLIIRLYRWASSVLYSRLAWAYDAISWIVSLGRWSGWRRAALDHISGTRVLDVGFGTGELLVEMAESGLSAFGLELSPAMQRVTARRLRRRQISPPRVRAPAQRMPFASGSFDSAVSTFPAWYILDQATLDEVARVVRAPRMGTEGGRLVVVGLVTGKRRRAVCPGDGAVLSATDERILAHYRGLARKAGLDVEIVVESEARRQVPIAISRKREA